MPQRISGLHEDELLVDQDPAVLAPELTLHLALHARILLEKLLRGLQDTVPLQCALRESLLDVALRTLPLLELPRGVALVALQR